MLQKILLLLIIGSINNQAHGNDKTKSLKVLVTVDWEGHSLEKANVKAMQAIRRQFPQVPMLHYLNAAYFTKPQANKEEVSRRINSTLLPGDRHGLHIHGWKTLVEGAGVKWQQAPAWSSIKTSPCSFDCGHAVPIFNYSSDELVDIIDYSIQLLTDAGYQFPVDFRSGGWVARANVLEALVRSGFRTDSSAVAHELLEDEIGGSRLMGWLQEIWPETNIYSQPYSIETTFGSILELPNNGALADYVSAREMIKVVNSNLSALYKSNEDSRLVVIGFHLETAEDWQDRMMGILDWLVKRGERFGDIEFITSYP